MSKSKYKLKRLCNIYVLISNHRYPNKEYIKEKIEDIMGNSYSSSSIEKDLFTLRMDFDVNIRYNRCHNGYMILNKNPSVFIFSLLQHLNISDLDIIRNSNFIKELKDNERRTTT